jgi:hypothetical protein
VINIRTAAKKKYTQLPCVKILTFAMVANNEILLGNGERNQLIFIIPLQNAFPHHLGSE